RNGWKRRHAFALPLLLHLLDLLHHLLHLSCGCDFSLLLYVRRIHGLEKVAYCSADVVLRTLGPRTFGVLIVHLGQKLECLVLFVLQAVNAGDVKIRERLKLLDIDGSKLLIGGDGFVVFAFGLPGHPYSLQGTPLPLDGKTDARMLQYLLICLSRFAVLLGVIQCASGTQLCVQAQVGVLGSLKSSPAGKLLRSSVRFARKLFPRIDQTRIRLRDLFGFRQATKWCGEHRGHSSAHLLALYLLSVVVDQRAHRAGYPKDDQPLQPDHVVAQEATGGGRAANEGIIHPLASVQTFGSCCRTLFLTSLPTTRRGVRPQLLVAVLDGLASSFNGTALFRLGTTLTSAQSLLLVAHG